MSKGSHRRSRREGRPGPAHIGYHDQAGRLGVSAPRPAWESAFHDLARRVLIDLTCGRDNSIDLLAGYPRVTHVNIEAVRKLAAVPWLNLAVVRQLTLPDFPNNAIIMISQQSYRVVWRETLPDGHYEDLKRSGGLISWRTHVSRSASLSAANHMS